MVSLLEERIIKADLTKTGKKVAEYLLQNASRLCFMTVLDVAKEANVSDASVIRVTRALGFSGFSDMQRQLRAKAYGLLETSNIDFVAPIENLANSGSETANPPLSLQRWSNTCDTLRAFLENNDPEKLEAAADIILSSRRRVVAGFRASACVARYLYLMLGLLIPDVVLSDTTDTDIVDKMMYMTQKDCVILISFPRYFSLAKSISDMAKDLGVKLIVITDKPTSPVASGADIVITAPSNRLTMFSSNMAAQYAAETLIEIVTQRAGRKNKKALAWKEKMCMKHETFCG